MNDDVRLPSEVVIAAELRELRRGGLQSLRNRRYPVLDQLAMHYQPPTGAEAGIEGILRAAVERLGDGPLGEAARLDFGFAPGTRGMTAPARRRQAAAAFDLQPESFRKQPEQNLMTEVAKELRRLALGGAAELASSTDAPPRVDWLERFEWYYRLYTEISGLRNDLDAALSLRRDQDGDEWQEYADFAFVHLAKFHLVLRRFIDEHAGIWLLGDPAAEEKVSNAVYKITRHTPLSERDESWLRMAIGSLAEDELHEVLTLLEDTDTGQLLLEEWRLWVEHCTVTDPADRDCPGRLVIQGCDEYLVTIDRAWRDRSAGG